MHASKLVSGFSLLFIEIKKKKFYLKGVILVSQFTVIELNLELIF